MFRRIFSMVVLVVICLVVPVRAYAVEMISRFQSDITVQPDSSLLITEYIQYDFDQNERHGIYRDIPRIYRFDTEVLELEPTIVSVTDNRGNTYDYSSSHSGDYVRIRIGNPNLTVHGSHLYAITYTVPAVINGFENHDELYWNVTGNGWDVPIQYVSATVHLPVAAATEELHAICYTGAVGSRERDCTAHVDSDSSYTFETTDTLLSREGITIVASFPKGLVTIPETRPHRSVFHTVFPIGLFVGASLLLFMFWFTRGRDPKGRGTIIAQYEPPTDMSPAEVGATVDNDMDTEDIVASVINLAVKGYLKIRREVESRRLLPDSTEYTFISLKSASGASDLTTTEKQVYTAIFKGAGQEVKLSTLKNGFYKSLPTIHQTVYDELIQKGIYHENPMKRRSVMMGFGMLIGIGAFVVVQDVVTATSSYWYYLLPLIGLEMILYAFIMPRRTVLGAQVYEHILGFKDFLHTTEKDRLKFFQSPETYETLYEKYLPYAVALGVEEEWAKQFPELKNAPEWFEGADHGNIIIFTHSLHQMNATMGQTFTSSPRSSGASGGSGGGFGGGGGGSW